MGDKHIIHAAFHGTACGSVESRYQYDYGQVLQIDGVDLPEAFEAHFANSDTAAETITMIGSDNSVKVPDELLLTGLPVYCWIYLHDEVTDGQTVYKIRIPVKARPEATNDEPTPVEQSAITQAIAALDAAVEKSETNVLHYPKIVNRIWHVWDAAAGEWVDTGISAEGVDGYTPRKGIDYEDGTDGVDGVSPIITIEQMQGGHVVTITDASGMHRFEVRDGIDGVDGVDGVNGIDGVDGVSPTVKVTTSSENVRTVTITDKDGSGSYRILDGVSPLIIPAPITDGTRLMIYDAQGSRYADIKNGSKGERGIPGADGFSPVLFCHETSDGYQIEVRDENGTQYFDLYNGQNGRDGADGQDGQDGADGFSPTIDVQTITGGHELTIESASGQVIVDIMDGVNGQDGAAGADGYTPIKGVDYFDGTSPTASVSKTGSTATITITDENGTTTAQVNDGENGVTPVRGTDYWTAADQAAIVSDVLDALDVAEGVSY